MLSLFKKSRVLFVYVGLFLNKKKTLSLSLSQNHQESRNLGLKLAKTYL